MCRYRLRLHSEVIIWRGWSTTNGSPFVRGESRYDVEHNAHAQKAKNYRNLKKNTHKQLKYDAKCELWSSECLIFYFQSHYGDGNIAGGSDGEICACLLCYVWQARARILFKCTYNGLIAITLT